jgi:hypothetical protein
VERAGILSLSPVREYGMNRQGDSQDRAMSASIAHKPDDTGQVAENRAIDDVERMTLDYLANM